MKDPVLYSTFRKEPVHKPGEGYSLSSFYDRMISPPSVLILVTFFFTQFCQSDIKECMSRIAVNGDSSSVMHILLIILTFVLGIRIIQSIYLAKRDYVHVKNGLIDVGIFALVALFTSGAMLFLWSRFPVFTLGFYVLLAFAGLVNFLHLYFNRIPKGQDQYDFPIERRIQATNSVIFAFLLISLCIALYFSTTQSREMIVVYCLICLNYPLVIYNIIHSQQLTYRPKFLFHNNADSPKNLAALFKNLFGPFSNHQEDEDILKHVINTPTSRYKEIKTVRVAREDVDLVCDTLLREFAYVFAYIFDTSDEKLLRKLIRTMITLAGGFGLLGYLNFYLIVTNSPEGKSSQKVGLFKADTVYPNWIYQLVEVVALPLILTFRFRFFNLFKIFKRAREIDRMQPATEARDIRLTYFAIFPGFQNQGYGTLFIQLLKGAVRNHTNDIVVDKITLCVRDKNTYAVKLFGRAGFLAPERKVELQSYDPLAALGAGKLCVLEWQPSWKTFVTPSGATIVTDKQAE